MNEEEKKAIDKFEKLGRKKFNEEKIKEEELLDYFDYVIILNLIEKQQKEITEKDQLINDMRKILIKN